MDVMFPTELACSAIGREPSTRNITATDCTCAMCGRPLPTGSAFAPFEPQVSFTDYTALRSPASNVICPWCDETWDRDFTQTWLKTIICREGIFPAASNDHLAYWLLNPPSGDWIFLQGDQKVQHVIWRAPINRSQEIFQVRAGETLLTIRRKHLQRGAEAARDLAAVATDLKEPKRGAPFKSPFLSLSRDRDSPSQGVLRPELYKHAGTDRRTHQHIDTINALTAGELWALTAVLYAQNPTRPTALNLKEA